MSSGLTNHPIVLRRLTVGRIQDLGPRMRRITLVGPELDSFERDGWSLGPFVTQAPDDHVKVFLAGPDQSEPVLPAQADGHLDWPHDDSAVNRDYTVRRFDAAAGELDLDFVVHSDGVATDWVRSVEVGAEVAIAGPRSSHIRPSADLAVLVGDETALPAIGRWIEEAAAGTRITAFVEVEDADDHQQIDSAADVSVTYVHRASGDHVEDHVRTLGPLGESAYAFVAGEHGFVQRVRRVLNGELGLPRNRCDAVGYWRKGVNEADEHELAHELRERADLLTPYAIRVAATLRLADHVEDGATTVSALAEATGADPTALGGLVGHLSTEGIFTLEAGGEIGLQRLGRALLDDHSGGERRRLDLDGADAHMDVAWAGLRHTVTTGQPGFDVVFGRGFWDHVHADPTLAASFDGSMAEWAYSWVPSVRDAYDWTRHRHIVDVGGGIGLLLTEVLGAAPDATGAVVELPATVATARWWFSERGLAGRAEAVEGSFFDALPEADAVVLAQVVHDWPDPEAATILANARDAVRPGGRVLLVERLLGDQELHQAAHAPMVLLMRNLFGATERSEEHLVDLAEQAGLVHRATHRAGMAMNIVELEPK